MPKEMYVCGVIGCGVEFVTPSNEVAEEWASRNQWHFSRLVRVKETL